MDYRQFMKFMESGELSGKESVAALQEYAKEFPYFQTAQSLLAYSMHEQQHVRYERQLKIAAAYAGDRRSLYNLIHPKAIKLFSDRTENIESSFITETILEKESTDNLFIDTGENPVLPPNEEETTDHRIAEESVFVAPSGLREEVEIPEIQPEEKLHEPVAADPHDIIRQRLTEILGLKEIKKETPLVIVEEKISVVIEHESETTEKKTDEREIRISDTSDFKKEEVSIELKEDIAENSTTTLDVIHRAEMEFALEASLIKSLEKLPPIEKQKPKKEQEPDRSSPEKISFFDWLKVKTTEGFGKIEEVHTYESETVPKESTLVVIEARGRGTLVKTSNENSTVGVGLLIDRFIEREPKIIPSKSEFYSPVMQAKKSVTEDEDLVSETLAKIYKQQGNLLKARSSYQKLSLLYPEKMAYFAALVLEIDKEINKQDKDDL